MAESDAHGNEIADFFTLWIHAQIPAAHVRRGRPVPMRVCTQRPQWKQGQKEKLFYNLVSRLEINVAWNSPLSSNVPRQITRSSSLTWEASMLLTFLLPCS
jgi:hypothetical protein